MTKTNIMKYIDYLNIAKKINIDVKTNKLILCHVYNQDLTWLYANFNSEINSDKLKKYLKLVKKYKNGYPLQYILGYVIFNNNRILINKNVLIPRNETELLVNKVSNISLQMFSYNDNKNLEVLDMCSGSGCISISLAKFNPNWKIIASDKSKKALKVAHNNIIYNNLNNVKIKKSDLFKSLKNKKFSVIICNPPYIDLEGKIYSKDRLKYEPKKALFAKDQGLEFYKKIFSQVLQFTNQNFLLAFEFGYQQKKAIEKLLNNYFHEDCFYWFEKDWSKKWRFLFVRGKIIT